MACQITKDELPIAATGKKPENQLREGAGKILFGTAR
jgi:hypothetical protein